MLVARSEIGDLVLDLVADRQATNRLFSVLDVDLASEMGQLEPVSLPELAPWQAYQPRLFEY